MNPYLNLSGKRRVEKQRGEKGEKGEEKGEGFMHEKNVPKQAKALIIS